MTYSEWNQLLASHFFGDDQGDAEVLLLVDRKLLGYLAEDAEDMAIQDFVRSIVNQDEGGGVGEDVCHKALRSGERWCGESKDGPPTFLGYLCLFVLAWTEDIADANRSFYDRLNHLLRQADNAERRTIGTLEPADELWGELQCWSEGAIGCGHFTARCVGGYIHIGFPKSQGFFAGSDRRELERMFDTYNLEPGAVFSVSSMEKLLQSHIGHFCTHGAHRCFERANDAVKRSMAEAACIILQRWDGSVQETTAGANHGARPPALRLRIALLKSGFNWILGARIEAAQGKILEEDIELSFQGNGLLSAPTYRGPWTDLLLAADGKRWQPPLGSICPGLLHVSGTQRNVWSPRRSVYVLEQNNRLGGYVETTRVMPGHPYHFLVDMESPGDWGELRNCNPDGCFEVAWEGRIQDRWQLWQCSGLTDCAPLGDRACSEEQLSLALEGGCRLGSRRREYASFAPPQVRVDGRVEDHHRLTYTINNGERVRQDANPDGVISIPRNQLQAGDRVTIELSDDNGCLRSVSFTLNDAQMSKVDDAWPTPELVGPNHYLFPGCLPEARYNGGTPLPGMRDGRTFAVGVGLRSPLEVSLLPVVPSLTVTCDGAPLQQSVEPGNYAIPGDLSADCHEILVTWHDDVIVLRDRFHLVEVPVYELRIDGCKFVKRDEFCALYVEQPPGNTRIVLTGDDTTHFVMTVANRHFRGGRGPITVAEGIGVGLHEIQVRWRGVIVGTHPIEVCTPPDIVASLRGGTKYRGGECFRTDDPPCVDVLIEGAPAGEIRLSCSDSQLVPQPGRETYCLPRQADGTSLVEGRHLEVTAHWGKAELGKLGIQPFAVLALPRVAMSVDGGRKDGNGSYALGSGYHIRLEQWDERYCGEFSVHDNSQGQLTIRRDGTIALDALQTGRHEISLDWLGESLEKTHLTIAETTGVTVAEEGGCELAPALYPPDGLPTLRVDPFSPGLTVWCGNTLLQADDQGRVRPNCDPADRNGDLRVKIKSGDVTVGHKTLTIASQEWSLLGWHEGQLCRLNETVPWLPCWYGRNQGRRGWELRPAIDCPGGDGRSCPCNRVPLGDFTACRISLRGWRKIASQRSISGAREVQARWARFRERR